ncbi:MULTISPECIES: transglycosylase domain-containing protein [Streptomyces]|uniref:Penicillin-binding protein n=2 Tax=Streptomyces TaxID=1883 RepID=A0A3R7I675_9ACTN|nr:MULTISPECIES: transglycosylase domain-containing protein [Streptomyces]KNE82160.1 penicillin-binding protein [Streptomyces fradiae]PQM22725.1 penicillin-binding protein [Streptomyces xinghaiensis]RKM97894.1 penicillin-binding protein [Streptomyces xinghaiensis]RNC73969.1 penicillin-binding protein [Streptomyces xinghaiensis]
MSDEPQHQKPPSPEPEPEREPGNGPEPGPGRPGPAPAEPAGAPEPAGGDVGRSTGDAGHEAADRAADGTGEGHGAGTADPAAGAAGTAASGAGAGASGAGTGAGAARRAQRTGFRRYLPTWRMVLGGVLLTVLLLSGGFATAYLLVGIPAANEHAVRQGNVYLYSDGTQLATDGDVNRQNVKLDRVPEHVRQAVLSAEDRDFYTESAVDPQAMLRGAWNTATGKGKQSGSTITQQYVKNYYLAQDQTLTRKAKEFIIAIKLDRETSKDEILEGYLNTSYFGRRAYGIQAAAHAYYRKNAEDLTTAEGAYLAALLNAPGYYDIATHPENKARALARWNYVLDGMVDEGWLSRSERSRMEFPTPAEGRPSSGMSGQRGYLVEAVKQYLSAHGIIGEDALEAGGHRIVTTIDRKRQDAFVEAVDEQLMSKLDKKEREVDRYVRAGGASIDPKTGKVVAMYGGIDYTEQYVNNATRRDYQVGSTFKPFVLAAAVDKGSKTLDGRPITPNARYDGTSGRAVQARSGSTGYKPENEDERSYGQLTVAEATDKSVNAVYAQMAQDVGPATVRRTAVGLGLPEDTPDLTPDPSVALGVATASVLDMTEAYATLANHGEHREPVLVTKITKGERELDLPRKETERAVSREAADTTTSVLKGVVEKGTGTAASSAGRPAAGKTGTAEEDRAAWFAGYTPDLATVVAVMGQDSETGEQKKLYGATGMARINGGGYPAQIWGQYTAAALKGSPAEKFDLKPMEGANDPDPGAPGDAFEEAGEAEGPWEDTGETGAAENPGETGGTDGPETSAPPTASEPPPTDDGKGSGGSGGDDTGGTDGGTDGGADSGGSTGGDTGGTGGDTGGTGSTGGTDGGTDGGGGTDTAGADTASTTT